jgi:hypothetical protein
MIKGVKTSAVRTLMLRELAKGPRSVEQLAAATGAGKRHIHIYLREAKAVAVGTVPRAGQGPRAAIWALPKAAA